MRILITGIFFLSSLLSIAQSSFQEDFSDGDLTTNPQWLGDTAKFIVNANNQLQSNGPPVTDEAILYTPITPADSTIWEFHVEYDFNPSGSNFSEVVLSSDQPSLKGSYSGYYVRIGDTDDEVSLYLKQGGTSTKLIDGQDDILDVSDVSVSVKVTRDTSGNWRLWRDTSGTGNNYTLEGSEKDQTHQNGNFFGLFLDYTSTRHDKFFFDDISITNTEVDTTGPSISSLVAPDNTTVRVFFDEPVKKGPAENLSNYSIDQGIGQPSSATLSNDRTMVELTLSNQLSLGDTFELTAQNQTDLSQNTSASLTKTFTFYQAQPDDIVFNELSPDPDSSSPGDIPDEEFVELLNTSPFAISLANWSFVVDDDTFSLPPKTIEPDSLIMLTDDSNLPLFNPYGNVISIDGWGSFLLTNEGANVELINDSGQIIDQVQYSDTWYDNAGNPAGWTFERILPDNDCDLRSNWAVSRDSSGGTPGRPTSVPVSVADNTGPAIQTVRVDSPTSVTLTFDEPLDSSSAAITSNYGIDSGLTVADAQPIGPDFTSVQVVLSPAMDSSSSYTINTNMLLDCLGDAASDTIDFALPLPAQKGEVIINEIMYDPDPPDLPSVDYVELFNRSNHAVDLRNWTFADATSDVTLPNSLLLQGEYVFVCDEEDVDSFRAAGYNNVLGVSSFPNLNQTGDDLILRSRDSSLINAVFYSQEWYNKEDEGWSLERIDPDVSCNNAGNWKESQAANGGTPGMENSVLGQFNDNTPPDLLRAFVHDSTHIELMFSEGLDSSTATVAGNYSIDNNIGQPDSADPIGPQFSSVDLFLNEPLEGSTIYTVTVDNITDCAGNTILMNNTARFGIPEPIDSFDIAINEVLFNPERGGNGVDYVELYNRSGQILDLSQLMIGEAEPVTPNFLNEQAPVSEQGYLFLPGTYIALSEDQELVKKQKDSKNPDNFIDISAMPNYPNDEGVVILAKDSNTFIDHLAYKDDWHFELLDDEDGVSLERISYEEPTQNEDNWHSAASTVGYGTPAYQNSQFGLTENLEDKVTVTPDVFSPDGDGNKDVLNINYQFQQGGYSANITIFDAKGREIKRLARNELLGFEGTFRWDGVTENGQKARIGHYVIYFEVFNESGDTQRFKKTAVLGGKID